MKSMKATIELQRDFFKEKKKLFYKNDQLTVHLFRYSTGIEALEINNAHGKMIVLPYMGQIIWDLEFDDIDLKMKNMFRQPKKATNIVDTYGCFAFHSGLISNGCPGPNDQHELHGEMACAEMDRAWLEVTDTGIKVCGETEYVKGFGHHYLASPTVEMFADQTYVDIAMKVQNMAGVEMPLQYMCHTNYTYLEGAVMKQTVPDDVFSLRKSIPEHVKPTQKWLDYNERLLAGDEVLTTLNQSDMYDPEIVFFADQLSQYGTEVEFTMTSPNGVTLFTSFSTEELNHATRWLLYNEDQQVGAFVLPATCRPEGFLAAEQSGTLIKLGAGEERSFTVRTGKK